MQQFYTFIILLLTALTLSPARAERVPFAHYTVEDGLSSNSVNAVCQDTAGFIWMATRYGVCRFDGVNFRKYDSNTHPVIQRNEVQFAFLLPDGRPAFSSAYSVFFAYDARKDSFQDISGFLPRDSYIYDVKDLTRLPDGSALLSTACGIYRFADSTRQFAKVPCDFLDGVVDVCTDRFGRYWVGHFNGWRILSSEGRTLPGANFKGYQVSHIFPLSPSHMLLSCGNGELRLAQITTADQVPQLAKVSTPFSYVNAIVAGKDGCFWVGTLDDGLWKCRFNGSGFSFEKVVPLNESEDALTKISSLFVDAQGSVWVSTQSSGVWRTTSVADYAFVKSRQVGLPEGVGSAFCEVPGGDVLMGTDGQGLYLFGPDLQLKQTVGRLSSNSVLTIVPDGAGEYLIGYWGGVTSRFNLQKGQMRKVDYTGLQNPHFTTKNILRTATGDLYVAATGDGVYHSSGGHWQKLVLTHPSMAGYPDLWFEGACQKPDGSVCLYSSRTIWSNRTGRFLPLLPDADMSHSSNPLHVNHCVAGADNVLYAATNKGIYVFGPDDAFRGVMRFVPACDYASLLIDSAGTLWASGVCGILAIDVRQRTHRCVVPQAQMPTSDYFTPRACLQASSGNLFFGCKDGFVCVQPGAKAVRSAQLLAFSQLYVRGGRVEVGTPTLPAPLGQLEELKLHYSQNHFSLAFDLIDFSPAGSLQARYRIPQLDTAWDDLGGKRAIDVAFLPAGSFTVQLAAFSGETPAQVVQLAVRVSPPWWQSPWFICLVLLLLAGVLFAFYRARMRRQVEQQRQLQLMVRERTLSLNQANRLLEQQKATVEEANLGLLNTLKQKDQLVSVVGHDLKNPMFAIVSTLRRMLTTVMPPLQQHQLLQKLATEAEGLQHQMVELMKWASADGSLSVCQPSAVNANLLVADALALLGGLAREKDIRLLQQGGHSLATWADARMLSTVVRNLVTNAIKFSPMGGSVVVELAEEEGRSLLRVQDGGVGMPQEKIDLLLSGQKVPSTSGTGSEAGFGFGLPIVVEYVRKNGGDVAIASQPGQGTTVTVSLPVCASVTVEPAPAPAPVPETPKKEVAIPINKELLAGKTILVVDDDDLILQHVSSLISPFVQVLQARDGAEGVAMAQAHVPDLIISDVDMPNLNGIEMLRQLSAQLLTSNIPLFFLSAKTDNSVRLQGLATGAIDYIAKPFEDDELLVKICNFLLWQQKLQLKALTRTMRGDGGAEPAETINPLLEKIIGLVKENYTNPLYSLADLVSALGMSKATLSRRMKSISDKTPMEILTEYRLNMAHKLLEGGDKTVSDVAYAVGFNDPSYFSRRFKEVFGISPTQLR